MADDRTRIATLVVVGSDGDVRGALEPRIVAEPWWQEVGSVADALPGCTVLRMLNARPDTDAPMGGAVSYLVHFDGSAPLQSWSGRLDSHPHRMPWADVAGALADLHWMRSTVELAGPPKQVRAWNLSSIWALPTSGPSVWFKGVPPFMGHEPAVLELLADMPVPRLIARDRHRQLLAPMEGHDGYRADDSDQRRMIEALVELQRSTMERVDDLASAGVPDLRSAALQRHLTDFVERVAPRDDVLAGLIDELPERLAIVDDLGPPPTLVHGDAHPGNCRLATTPPLWFDWGDSFIASPLFDLATADRWPAVGIDSWLELWDAAAPGGDARAAWAALEPIAALRLALLYQSFLDNIEPSEHIFHEADVPEHLERTRNLL